MTGAQAQWPPTTTLRPTAWPHTWRGYSYGPNGTLLCHCTHTHRDDITAKRCASDAAMQLRERIRSAGAGGTVKLPPGWQPATAGAQDS